MKNSDTLRILLFEADRTLRNTFSDYVRAEPGLELVGEFSNFWEANIRVRQLKPHATLIDLDMAPNAPFLALRNVLAIRRTHPGPVPAIIVLSRHQDDERIIQSYCAGGDISYLLKPVSCEVLAQTIRRAVKGDPYANDYVSRRSRELLGNPINRANARRLSKREFLALRLLKQGYTQKEAADKMGIKSVNDTLKSVYRKLGVHNQRDAENMVWYNHLAVLGRIESNTP